MKKGRSVAAVAATMFLAITERLLHVHQIDTEPIKKLLKSALPQYLSRSPLVVLPLKP